MFSFDFTNKNSEKFGPILQVADKNGKLIESLKISNDKLSFKIKDNDPFSVCEFLTEEQIWDYMKMTKQEKVDN